LRLKILRPGIICEGIALGSAIPAVCRLPTGCANVIFCACFVRIVRKMNVSNIAALITPRLREIAAFAEPAPAVEPLSFQAFISHIIGDSATEIEVIMPGILAIEAFHSNEASGIVDVRQAD
jgi:hypothetical protein